MILNGNLDTPIKNSKLYKDNIHTASSIKKFLFFLIRMTIAKSNRRQVTQKIAKKISKLCSVYSKFNLLLIEEFNITNKSLKYKKMSKDVFRIVTKSKTIANSSE
jgi:hypothetical protein